MIIFTEASFDFQINEHGDFLLLFSNTVCGLAIANSVASQQRSVIGTSYQNQLNLLKPKQNEQNEDQERVLDSAEY